MKMSKFLIPLGAFVLLAIVLAVGIKRSPEKGIIASPFIGKAAPQFSLPDLSQPGKSITTADLKGRWYAVNFFGSWCYACRQEHPTLMEVSQSRVLPIIGFDWKEQADSTNEQDDLGRAFLNQLGNPYTLVLADRDGRTAIDYGVTGAPETYLVNPEGIIVYKLTGQITKEIWEKEFVARVQGKPGKS